MGFPDKYPPLLDAMRTRAESYFKDSAGSISQRAQTFFRIITRQKMLAATVPWLTKFWAEPSHYQERFLAAEYAVHHLSGTGTKLKGNPFQASTSRYDGDGSLPKFEKVVDVVLKKVRKEAAMALIFSQYVALASFAQDVGDLFSRHWIFLT